VVQLVVHIREEEIKEWPRKGKEGKTFFISSNRRKKRCSAARHLPGREGGNKRFEGGKRERDVLLPISTRKKDCLLF